MKLSGFFRLLAAFRRRIALNLKSFAVEHVTVYLAYREQFEPAFADAAPGAQPDAE
jgi:hypothetical protein